MYRGGDFGLTFERSPCAFGAMNPPAPKVPLLPLRLSKREPEPLTGVLSRLEHKGARLAVAPLEMSLKNLRGVLCSKSVWQLPVYRIAIRLTERLAKVLVWS